MNAQYLLARAAMAAALAIAAGSAQAIPLTFAFTGTVRDTIISDEFGNATVDTSRSGQAVTGSITVQTSGLLPFARTDAFGTTQFFDDPGNPELITSVLSIGGISYDVGAYGQDAGFLWVLDSSGPVSCGNGCSGFSRDQVGLSDGSATGPSIFDPVGSFESQSLTLGWHDPNNPLGLIDLSAGFDPLDVLNIPVGLITGSFSQFVETCVEGTCEVTSATDINFLFNSFTVTVAQVPEPGTLALFMFGLLGTALARRRRVL